MWTDKNDGRVFGAILVLIGTFVILLAVWQEFAGKGASSALTMAGPLIVAGGLLSMRKRSERDQSDAG